MIRRVVEGSIDWVYGIGWWFHAFTRRGHPEAFAEAGPDAVHHTPLVLLPGIWERWQYLVPLARELNAYGHPVHLIPALGANGSPLPASAAIVARFLVDRQLTGAILVAHSKGGLIGKLVMLDAGVADRIVGMVALNTPFAGSSLAWRIFSRSPLGVFTPSGEAITELGAQRDVNARIVSLLAAHDQVIPEGSALPGARNVALKVGGHFRPLRDAGVHRTIHELIHELEGTPQ